MVPKRKWFIVLLGIGALLAAARGHAGPATLQEQLVGTWTFVGTEVSATGGRTLHVDTPSTGILVFTSDGRFAQIELVAGVARAASRSRVRGAGEDGNGTRATESVALFGTYAVDEAARTVTYMVHSSTVPDADATRQKRTIQSLTADELRLAGPAGQPSAGSLWKRAAEGGR